MIVKIVVIRSETINEVMNPSGGRFGRDKNISLGIRTQGLQNEVSWAYFERIQ